MLLASNFNRFLLKTTIAGNYSTSLRLRSAIESPESKVRKTIAANKGVAKLRYSFIGNSKLTAFSNF